MLEAEGIGVFAPDVEESTPAVTIKPLEESSTPAGKVVHSKSFLKDINPQSRIGNQVSGSEENPPNDKSDSNAVEKNLPLSSSADAVVSVSPAVAVDEVRICMR